MKALETRSLYWVYGSLLAAGIVLELLSPSPLTDPPLNVLDLSWPASVAALVLGVALVIIYRLVGRIFRWGRSLKDFLKQTLTPLSYLHAIVIAIITAVIEEWFFRGLLLPRFGLVLSSLIFALANILPHRQKISWMAWNLVFGLLLGVLAKESGTFWTAAFAHSLFNLSFLIRLNQEAYRSAAS